jgi:hypothetical protein
MKRSCTYKLVMFGVCNLLFAIYVNAQKDASKTREVQISSTFKPELREAAKINLNATPPVTDTSKAKLQYTIPDENLLFAYQPGSLKPLALDIDSGGRWNNNSYVKAGFGSLKTPYLQGGISFGDGKTSGLNVYAKHVSSQGKRDYQDFANTEFSLNGFIQTAKNLEWDARLGMKNDLTYKYGFLPESLNFPKDSLKQNFQTWTGRLSFHNLQPTEFGLSYAPEVKIDVFSDNHNNNESNSYLNIPLRKEIGDNFAVNLGVSFDLTRYKPSSKQVVNNTMWDISPSVSYKSANFSILGGIRPTWDPQTTKIYPNIMAEIGTTDQRFTLLAGWTGYLRKTSYMSLASYNPWIWAPSELRNTGIVERYVGFKGSLMDHFSYSGKLGYNTLTNQPLFVNDTIDGKSFVVLNEAQMNVWHIGGQLAYNVGEKFSLTSGLDINQYSNLHTFKGGKAWGLIPIEFTTALRLQILKDLYLNSDIFVWDRVAYRNKNGSSDYLKGAADVNAGLEFQITKNLKAWAQFNNIFNKEYQRWNQYPVYGFNFLGGIIFAFDQKN